MKARKPSNNRIRAEIRKLRQYINKEQDIKKLRVAQIMEESLQWTIEETTWKGPLSDINIWSQYL